MSDQDIKEILMRVESESGLKAVEMYMDLRWAEFIADVTGKTFVVLFAIIGIPLVAYCIQRSSDEEERPKS